jgi:hypothetical protein
LKEFIVSDKNWKAEEVAVKTLLMQPELANAYVGLFTDQEHPTGTTRLIHAPRRFAAKLGKPSHFDYKCFAILDNVTSVAKFPLFEIGF